MTGQLYKPHRAFVVRADNSQGARTQNILIFWIEAKITTIRLLNLCPAVAASNQRIRLKGDAHRATNQRASEPRYEKPRCLWVTLLMFGINKTEHVPRILQDDMLEAP